MWCNLPPIQFYAHEILNELQLSVSEELKYFLMCNRSIETIFIDLSIISHGMSIIEAGVKISWLGYLNDHPVLCSGAFKKPVNCFI